MGNHRLASHRYPGRTPVNLTPSRPSSLRLRGDREQSGIHHEPTRGSSDPEAVGALLFAGDGRHGVPCADLSIPVSLAASTRAHLRRRENQTEP